MTQKYQRRGSQPWELFYIDHVPLISLINTLRRSASLQAQIWRHSQIPTWPRCSPLKLDACRAAAAAVAIVQTRRCAIEKVALIHTDPPRPDQVEPALASRFRSKALHKPCVQFQCEPSPATQPQSATCSTTAFPSPSSSIKIPYPSQCPRSTRYVLQITAARLTPWPCAQAASATSSTRTPPQRFYCDTSSSSSTP